MDSREFVAGLREEIVQANVSTYRQLFEETRASEATDPYWRDALMLFSQLTQEQREILFRIIRQVVVDTTSNLLAVLDGVTRLRGQKEDLTLLCGPVRLDGDLQDPFLEAEERG
jgi:hypothetical protein